MTNLSVANINKFLEERPELLRREVIDALVREFEISETLHSVRHPQWSGGFQLYVKCKGCQGFCLKLVARDRSSGKKWRVQCNGTVLEHGTPTDDGVLPCTPNFQKTSIKELRNDGDFGSSVKIAEHQGQRMDYTLFKSRTQGQQVTDNVLKKAAKGMMDKMRDDRVQSYAFLEGYSLALQ